MFKHQVQWNLKFLKMTYHSKQGGKSYMINENEMKLEFLSKSNNEAFARITVAAFVASLDPTIEEISDIKMKRGEIV